MRTLRNHKYFIAGSEADKKNLSSVFAYSCRIDLRESILSLHWSEHNNAKSLTMLVLSS